MRKQLLMLLMFAVVAAAAWGRTVTGTVTQASDGEPVIGVTVKVQGTSHATATDLDGKYSIEASDGQSLVFTFVGMQTVTRRLAAGQSVVDVVMHDDSQVLQEVVVTAYGQTQEKKKLNFAVQTLNSSDVTAGGATNFANTLQGKVAGLQVGTGGGSPNSDTQILIRSISSMNNGQNNEPLIVVDGVAIRGGGSSMGTINPEDIENVNVLKGAAASALYGSEGMNGVIMITTKSAAREGKVDITAAASVEISRCMRVPKVQSMFMPGSKGFYRENVGSGGWGPYMRAEDTRYDNVGGFLGTGLQQRYSLTASGGTEKFNAYTSVSYTRSDGVVPKDYKNQLTAFVKTQFKPSDKVTILASMNYTNSKARGFGNSMSTIYNWGINKDMSHYIDENGDPYWANRYDNWAVLTDRERIDAAFSPYFGRYLDKSETRSDRLLLNGQVSYEPIKDLVFTGKVGYDFGYSMYDAYVYPRFRDSYFNDPTEEQFASILNDSKSLYGSYSFQPSRSEALTAQFFANYKRTFAEDYTINLFYGLEYREGKGLSASMGGYKFLLDNFYSFANVDPDTYKERGQSVTHSSWNKFGHFWEVRFDYKGLIQLSATGRWDGSSRFKQAIKPVYFYPSVTGGIIFSELFHWQNSWFSYGKLRGNWAKVGKDSPAYLFDASYKRWTNFPDPGYGRDPTVSYADPSLAPEMMRSWEIGADLRFFNSRTRLDIAYYSTTVDNQIVSVRVSPTSGDILQTRNEGSLKNHGVELSIQQDIFKTADFDWTATLNYSFNRGKVTYLPDQLTEIQGTQYGDIFPVARLNGSSTGLSGKDYQRDPDGNVVCDASGYPLIDPAKGNYIGNREPKCLLGFGSSFRYKSATLSFLLDGRVGGDVANVTGRSLLGNGMNHLYDKYRNREIIFKGVVKNADGTYSPNTTPVVLDSYFMSTYFYPVSSNFIEDGSYLRLSYVTLAYDFSSLLKPSCPVKGLSLSVTGRNLFLLTKYTGNDPAIMAASSYGTGGMGIDNYNVPSTRNFNISLKVSF